MSGVLIVCVSIYIKTVPTLYSSWTSDYIVQSLQFLFSFSLQFSKSFLSFDLLISYWSCFRLWLILMSFVPLWGSFGLQRQQWQCFHLAVHHSWQNKVIWGTCNYFVAACSWHAILKHFHAKAVGVILFYILAHIIYLYLFLIAVVYFKRMMWNNFCTV